MRQKSRTMHKLILAIMCALFCAWLPVAPAYAQQLVILPGGCNTGGFLNSIPYLTINTTGQLCTAASVSASITGFPGSSQTTGTPIAVTTGGVTGTLPVGTVVVATNVGTTNGAYCKLGASATASDQYIAPNGGWFAFTVGSNSQLTCITSTSTTTVNMVGGSGIPTGTGGGSGGGSGGTVTQGPAGASAWLVTGTGGTFPIATWAGGTLGAMANYGTSPGAVLVPGVNASVTASALPTGAATSANQTATQAAVGGATAPTNATIAGCTFNTSLPTLTTGQSVSVQCDSSGRLLLGSLNPNGRAVPGSSAPVVLASQIYNTVAASASAQVLTGGSGGATGDWLDFIEIIPATTAAGAVSITDGGGSAITVWAGGGTTALTSLVPFTIPVRAVSAAGAWKVTTGTNVSVIAVGNFH